MGGAISGLVVLGSIREQAEQAKGSKPVRNILPWPLHQLLIPGSYLWDVKSCQEVWLEPQTVSFTKTHHEEPWPD